MSKIIDPKYVNAKRNDTAIKEAYLSLIASGYSPDGISVTKLMQTAKLNRGTFYNHYETMNDLAEAVQDQIISQIFALFASTVHQTDDIYRFVDSFNQAVRANEAILSRLVNSAPLEVFVSFRNRLKMRLKEVDASLALSERNVFFETVVINGIAGAYVEYFTGSLNITLDEMASYMKALVRKVLS